MTKRAIHWAALAILSFVFVAGLERLQLPAALLLGPLAAAALTVSAGVGLAIAPPVFYVAQAIVGCSSRGPSPSTRFPKSAATGRSS
jgi:uncharacterized membrane protein AbrB (regulator of aidB expression)